MQLYHDLGLRNPKPLEIFYLLLRKLFKRKAQNNTHAIFKHLEAIAEIIPMPMYWINTEGIILNANFLVLKALGLSDYEDIVGKEIYDFHPKDIADHIVVHNTKVMQVGKTLSQEEWITDFTTGKIRHFSTVKTPLYDDQLNVIGMLGAAIEITAEKEAEFLRNEAYKAVSQEQEKFKKIADQVTHDIRSPLASLLMMVKASQAIPERERIALREAATTIGDIANNLLSHYRKKESSNMVTFVEERESILVSPIILQILTDKKYQYQNLPIKFDHHFSQNGNFAWIDIELTAFKRTLSNIINNAVDAFDQKEGKVTLHLNANQEQVTITIEDNGKGMMPELVRKIMSQVAVTDGKENGHGIGLTQVRETLQNNQGQWMIDSQLGDGTKVILTFPRTLSQKWIAEMIELNHDDTVIILDDDSSIHLAWDTRFDMIRETFPSLTVVHVEMGQEAFDLINRLTPDKKQKIFLLTDYELLKQNWNGLDVIKKTGIRRSILVTSHYANKSIRHSASETDTKILPKQLASDIPINIIQARSNVQITRHDLKKVDAVFVDDDRCLLDSFTFLAFNKEVDTYYDPQHFLDNASQYHKNTKIMLDYHFANFELEGIQIAKQLHALEFTRLYLLSGANLSKHQIPDYLTVITKTDLNELEAVINE